MSSVSIEEFVAVIERSKDRTRVELNQFLIRVIMACVEEVVVGGEFGPGTPVDTGFLRAMWWMEINGVGSSPNLVPPDRNARSPGEPMLFPTSVEDVLASVLDVMAGDTVSLNNNTEYAAYVENGTSTMEPRAFVKSVANAAQAIASRVATEMGWNSQTGIQLGLGL